MPRISYRFCVLLSLVLICGPAARAQQQQQPPQQPTQQQQQPQQAQDQSTQPIPAYHSPLAGLANGGNAQEGDQNPEALSPDKRSLAGAQDLALGVPREEHSFWEPNFTASSTADSNPLSATTATGWATYTTLLGGIDIHRISEKSDLSVNYLGGGMISNDPGVGNAVIQDLAFDETLTLHRSTLTFLDQGSYIPDTGFGFTGTGLLGGNLGLQGGFAPEQSILTSRGQRLVNTSIAQVDVYLTPRTSLTFVGGYTLLHFFGTDLLNFGDSIFQAGYNYQLTRQDTIAVLYNFSAFRFSGESINDNRVNLSYGRRVTGRMAFQVAAGPEVTSIQVSPSAGSGGATGGGGVLSPTTGAYWSLNSGLTYQLQRAVLGLTYFHGVNGGSGVLPGAVGDTVLGSANRQLSRTLGGGVRFGYSRNSGITSSSSGQSYDYWFGGASLNHPWGRSLNLALSYQVQYQNSSSAYCIGPTCGDSTVRHIISVSLVWHEHPFAF